MTEFSLIASVVLIHLLAVISPGPDFVMAVKNTLTYSRKTGIYTAIGFGLGIGVHIFYSLFGLALIIAQKNWVFQLIQYLGAAYLIYIGIQSLRSTYKKIQVNQHTIRNDISSWHAIRIGFLTNVLNPKASLFFLSLFTYIIQFKPQSITLIVISSLLIINTSLWFSIVAIFFNQKLVRQKYEQYQKGIQIVLGIILIFLGFSIAIYS